MAEIRFDSLSIVVYVGNEQKTVASPPRKRFGQKPSPEWFLRGLRGGIDIGIRAARDLGDSLILSEQRSQQSRHNGPQGLSAPKNPGTGARAADTPHSR